MNNEKIQYLIDNAEYDNKPLLDYIKYLQNQLEAYENMRKEAIEYLNNFSVDKSFSFPLMKRWEENQVKSSIDYEFNDTLKKDLLNIINKVGGSDE